MADPSERASVQRCEGSKSNGSLYRWRLALVSWEGCSSTGYSSGRREGRKKRMRRLESLKRSVETQGVDRRGGNGYVLVGHGKGCSEIDA